MLAEAFELVYTKFKMHFYQQVFQRFEKREATLTTVESFCMEAIVALGHPTVAEFSQFMNISTPNAAYKVNSLIQKGYVEKVRSQQDRREYHLCPTKKYLDYYNISYAYLETVVKRVEEHFSPQDVEKLEQMLNVVGRELMPEMTLDSEKQNP
ncbi:MAG: MarR family winged helix-turn-helix transcriptional regulator [Pygmaiobacter massiliensis]|nr:MarR family winged helix-turn-helix transcriptional regulator [Pygmaiobacter massiliensis]